MIYSERDLKGQVVRWRMFASSPSWEEGITVEDLEDALRIIGKELSDWEDESQHTGRFIGDVEWALCQLGRRPKAQHRKGKGR